MRAVKYTIMIVVLLSGPVLLKAQPIDPQDTGVPIDGGLSLLLAAGAGYGVKKIRQYRNKKEKGKNE